MAERRVGGPAACLAGSCSEATLAQIAHAKEIMPVLQLDPERLIEGSAEVNHALTWAYERLAAGPVLIASSSSPERVNALQAQYSREGVGHAIEQAMATIAERLVAWGVRRLIVAGGETSGAVTDRLEIPAFVLGPEIAAGVPVLYTVGAKCGSMALALKSGNFGGPKFFAEGLQLML